MLVKDDGSKDADDTAWELRWRSYHLPVTELKAWTLKPNNVESKNYHFPHIVDDHMEEAQRAEKNQPCYRET